MENSTDSLTLKEMRLKSTLVSLLGDLEKVFEKSDIKQFCHEKDYQWFYSLITTTLKTGGPLVLGFNWGASNGVRYNPQKTIEQSDFEKEDVGSLSRIFPFCRKYFGNEFLSRISQSNYCFFRSKEENQISNKDMSLCEPILEKLIAAVKPSSVLCFSAKLRSYLIKNDKIKFKESKVIKFKRGPSFVTYEAIKGTMSSGIEIKFLPHPNYPMDGEARAKAWEFCCGKC